MMKSFFITATGTDQGKTFVTAALTGQLRRQGHSVQALKPVMSGYEAGKSSDASVLLQAMGQTVNETTLAAISPWRYRAPLSPDYAARLENCEIPYSDLLKFCRSSSEAEYMLIEGAGGTMSPLGRQHTQLELVKELDVPVILVSGCYLGAISHTLTTLAVLQGIRVRVCGLVVTQTSAEGLPLPVLLDSLEPHLPAGITIKALAYQPDIRPWDIAVDLTPLVHHAA